MNQPFWMTGSRAVSVAVLFIAAAAWAAPLAPEAVVRPPDTSVPSQANPFAAVLHSSEEASALMKRADEGIERQDWKLAIDSLQRIIELPGDHILTTDGRLYESARRCAQRRLAAIGEPGLRAYRLLHDGEAAALFEQAKLKHDEALLKNVVDRFLLSSAGTNACLTLADWLMDEGRFTEAATLLNRARSLKPSSDPLHRSLVERAVIALAASGLTSQALHLLEQVTTLPADTEPQTHDPIEQIRAWIAQREQTSATAETKEWPCNQGNCARTGQMDLVEADFPPEPVWRVPLPIAPPREGFDAINTYAIGQGLWPIAQPVTDGRALYLKSGPRLLAVDVDTFETLWTSQSHAGDQVLNNRVNTNMQMWMVQSADEARVQYATGPFFIRTYQDTVGSSVALAFGEVLTVEWPGDPPIPPALWLEDGRPNLVQGRFDPGALTPNRIAAYNPADGKLLWSSDTAGGEGELAGLQFLAAPFPVAGYLLAPCRVQNDLYAVLLDPHTGRLARYIYLCGTGGGGFNSLHACDPCLAGGTIYLPTGRGVLVALDAGNLSVRWILRYDTTARKRSASSWQTPQVVAAGDVVLLAPSDADQLLCIDRETAKIRWSVERGDAQYIAAADDRFAWFVGKQVSAIDLGTGQPVWSRQVPQPAGRGALSGRRLYLPTLNGLVVLNAETGEPLDAAKPLLGDLLGNLLSFDFALYSTDALFLRKFPDMNRGYERVLALHKADPADGSVAIRLASLELLRDRPAEALGALETVPPTFAEADPVRSRYLTHLRVAALLRLAAADSTPLPKAREFLEKANRIASSPRDAIDSTLALGEFHVRQGRPLDACREYLSLMLGEAGDEMLSGNEGLERRARDIAGQRLATILSKLSPTDAVAFIQLTRDRLQSATANHDERSLLWLSESETAGIVAHEASLVLAKWALDSFDFERAESLLMRVLRDADSPPLQAEAAARLAVIYLQPDELHQPLSASTMLNRLEGEYATIAVPAAIADQNIGSGTAASMPSTSDSITGAQLAGRLRSRIDTAILARHREALARAEIGSPRTVDTATYVGSRPVLVRGEPCEPLIGHRLMLTNQNQLEVHDTATGKLLWPVELRLLSELTVDSENDRDTIQLNFPRIGANPDSSARALMEGQSLIMTSPMGLHAVGSLTGRRLWSRPFDPPCLPGQDPSASDAWLWAEDGSLVSVDARGRLEMCRVESGDRILWRRADPHRHWHWVRGRGTFLAAIDADLERTDIFRLRDGGMIGTCVFAQPPDRVNLALFDKVICGPVSEREVAAFELAAPGIQRWRFAVASPLSQLFKPAPEWLAVADQAGRLAVIDPATGEAKWRTTVESCANGITDGILQDEVLYVCGLQLRSPQGRPSDFDQRWAVAAVRWSDGQVLWQNGNLPARAYLNADVLAAAANAIPVAVFTPARAMRSSPLPNDQRSDRRNPVNSRLELNLMNKANGQPLGGPLITNLPLDTGTGSILDLRVVPGAVEIVVGANHVRIECPPANK